MCIYILYILYLQTAFFHENSSKNRNHADIMKLLDALNTNMFQDIGKYKFSQSLATSPEPTCAELAVALAPRRVRLERSTLALGVTKLVPRAAKPTAPRAT